MPRSQALSLWVACARPVREHLDSPSPIFHSETVPSATRPSKTGGDVIGADVAGWLAPKRRWL